MKDKIICPNLRLGVSYNLITPDEEGWVLEEDLRNFLRVVGIEGSTIVQETLIQTAKSAVKEKRRGYVNIYKLKDTFLTHGSSSGILHEGFDQNKLDLLKTFMVEGKLASEGIAAACTYYHKCPVNHKSLFGTNLYSFEMENFLEVYGRVDEEGNKYFTEQDVDDLWKHNKFPEGWNFKMCPVLGTWTSVKNWLKSMIIRFKQ
jgi:hypothetical protein